MADLLSTRVLVMSHCTVRATHTMLGQIGVVTSRARPSTDALSRPLGEMRKRTAGCREILDEGVRSRRTRTVELARRRFVEGAGTTNALEQSREPRMSVPRGVSEESP
jgi:hypothetical protein